jgi:uncharacterized membrane protein YkoI
MKKLITITAITAVVVVGGLIGMLQAPVFASNPANFERAIVRSLDEGVPLSMPPVSLDAAQATVMAQHPGTAIIKVHLQGTVADPVWRFELMQSDGSRIDVRVDAETGLILKTAENGGITALPTIGFTQAKTMVLNQYPGASIIKAELEREEGVLTWKMHLLTSDGRLLKVSVDGTAGTVLADREIKRVASPTVSLAEAKATVMAEFPGATIERAQFKDDESPTVWHFRLITADGMSVRVDVDAETGDMLEVRVKESGGNRSGSGSGRGLGIERDNRGNLERADDLQIQRELERQIDRDARGLVDDDRSEDNSGPGNGVRPNGKSGGHGPG